MGDFWRLVLVDALFLVLAAGLALWLRGLLRHQRREVDAQLQRVEVLAEQLSAVQEGLASACARLDELADGGAPPEAGRGGAVRPADPHDQAWRLLHQGLAVGEVARRLGLGRSEVELMSRIQRHRRRLGGAD